MSEELEKMMQVAFTAMNQGDLKSALEHFSKALEKAQEENHTEYIAVCLYNLGRIKELGGNYDLAMEKYQESLEYCELLDQPSYKATCLGNIAMVKDAWGNPKEALADLQQALAIWDQYSDNDSGAQFGKAATLNSLGQVYHGQGQFEEALSYHQQSLEIKRALNDIPGMSISLNNLGMVALAQGRYKDAMQYFEEAVKIYSQLDGAAPWGVPLANMGEIYRVWGDFEKAQEKYQQALKIYRSMGDERNIAIVSNNLGILYVNWGKLDQALEHQNEAMKTWDKLGAPRLKAITTNNIGDIYKFRGAYDEALNYYQEALGICDEIGAKKEKGLMLSSVGMVHVSTGAYEEAAKYFKQAIKMSEETGDLQARAYAYNNLGLVSQGTGKFEEAISNYSQALEIFTEAGDVQGKFTAENNIGEVYFSWGKFEKALEFFKKCLADIEKYGFTKDMSIPLNNIGKVYLTWSKYDEALKHLNRALEMAKSVQNKRDTAISLASVGLVYRVWGKYKEAIEYYEQANKLQNEMGDIHQSATSLNNIGEVYFLLKYMDKALEYYEEAQHLFQQVNDPRGLSLTINNIGLIRQVKGDYQGAIEDFQKVLAITDETGDIHSKGIALNNIAIVYQAWQRYDESIEYLSQALQICRDAGDKNRESLALSNMGFSRWWQKQYAEALKLFIQAIDIQEGLIGGLKSEEVRISYRATQLGPYEAITEMMIEWYLDDGDEAHLREGLKFLELSKAREIIDKLESGRVKIETCPELKKLIELEQQLVSEISQLESIAETESRTGKARSVTLSELEEKGNELKKIRAQLMEKCKDPGLIRVTKEYDPVPDFQKLFKEEDLIIWEFLYFPNWYQYQEAFRVLVWEKDKLRVFDSNQFDKEMLEALNLEFHEMLSSPKRRDREKVPEKLEELQKRLSDLLPEDLIQTLENKKKLILIPHGVLHLFPWEIVEQVGLKIPIVRSYSLGLLRSCMKREQATQNVLLIANPNYNIDDLNLPGADLEARSIKKALKKGGEKFELLDHEEAVESTFANLINSEFGIIHFAGHGVYDPTKKDPWMSGLLFYRKSGYDIRTVTELVQQRFKGTPLFILSACETGRSKVSKGDEMVGLIRGLTLAGATSIVATNWLLSDLVAPHFMRTFYESFLKGKDVCESLFAARKEIRELYKDPLSWGVYTLYGNPFKRQ